MYMKPIRNKNSFRTASISKMWTWSEIWLMFKMFLEYQNVTFKIADSNNVFWKCIQMLIYEPINYLNKIMCYPAGNYMYKVNNRNIRTRCEICSKLAIKRLSLLLTLNIFHTFFWCFFCKLWAGKCQLGLLLVKTFS